jgi:hypothetical protein
MKKIILFFALFVFTAANTIAQEVVSTAGETNTITGYEVSWTLGEPVIQTISSGSTVLTQGFHQSKLTVTAIDELLVSDLELKVYPNPTQDFVTISLSKMPENLIYSVFDLSGKLLENNRISNLNTKIDMQHYSGGSYILKLKNKNQLIQTFKIIKQ